MNTEEEATRITMDEVRLLCGEGKLSARDVLNAVNVILKQRAESAAAQAREADKQ